VLCPWRSDCAGLALGIAEELPVAAAKPERPLRRGVAFWLQRPDGAVMLRRRPEKGLLGGMIELPSTPWREAEWSDVEALDYAPAKTPWTILPGNVEHGFTHFRLELTLMAATTSEVLDGIWAKPTEFKDYAFSTLTKKLTKYALAGWQPPTADPRERE
jgi:A/G-specific adenine glycosylase